jgi:hypothetical protein
VTAASAHQLTGSTARASALHVAGCLGLTAAAAAGGGGAAVRRQLMQIGAAAVGFLAGVTVSSRQEVGCCTDALGSTDQGGDCRRRSAAVRRCCCSALMMHASAWSLSSSRGCRELLAVAAGACCCAVARLQETGWGWAGQRKQQRTMHAASCCASSVSVAATGPA